jgi:hypothetical protein
MLGVLTRRCRPKGFERHVSHCFIAPLPNVGDTHRNHWPNYSAVRLKSRESFSSASWRVDTRAKIEAALSFLTGVSSSGIAKKLAILWTPAESSGFACAVVARRYSSGKSGRHRDAGKEWRAGKSRTRILPLWKCLKSLTRKCDKIE